MPTPSYPPAPWHVVYSKRLRKHDRAEPRPGMTFLNACPTPIRYQRLAIVKAVADAPPPAFGGGGKRALGDECLVGLRRIAAVTRGATRLPSDCGVRRAGAGGRA